MKKYFFVGAFLLTITLDLLVAGCSKSPMAPARVTALNVSIPMTNELKSSLVGSTSNLLFYQFDGAQAVSILAGEVGPFSSPVSSGSFDFTVPVPPGAQLLSLELDDTGSPSQALAVGALDLSAGFEGSDRVVEMGSVTRNCYFVNDTTSYAYYSYGFNSDLLTGSVIGGPNYDIQVEYFASTSGAYYFSLQDGSGNTTTPVACVAYMGNGKLVNYDGVPGPSRFSSASTLCKTAALGAATSSIEAGDVYCVKLNSIPGGFAWMQIANAGGFPTCPSFVFRVNHTQPFYAYDQTLADAQGGTSCSSTW